MGTESNRKRSDTTAVSSCRITRLPYIIDVRLRYDCVLHYYIISVLGD